MEPDEKPQKADEKPVPAKEPAPVQPEEEKKEGEI